MLISLATERTRLPHGVRLAYEENACVVVLGTGASELDGVVEGRWVRVRPHVPEPRLF